MKVKWMFAAMVALAACKPVHREEVKKPVVTTMPVPHKDTAMMQLAFGSKKDPVCGMPVSAGITDTVTYKKKLYGFCSKECKEEFLKNPAKALGQ